MNAEMLERILRCPSLPSLPAVAVRVIELTQCREVRLHELAAVIQNDQALAAKILRTVNSSFYGLRRRCSTINQALVMLGLSTVKSLALGFSLVTSLGNEGDEGDPFDYIGYWRRGLFTAVGAKCVAKALGRTFEDEAFLGGLLQDVGVMAMYRALEREYLVVMLNAGGDHRRLARAELEAFELQHADVGAMLCQRWKLADELIMSVKYHERPTAAPPEHADLVRCVALGNLAHDILTDADPTAALRTFQSRAQSWFGVIATDADDILRRIGSGAREVSSLFRLDVGGYADADAILDEAQAKLAGMVSPGEGEANHGFSLAGLVSDGDEVDALTGVLGRRELMARAEKAFERSRGGGLPASLLHVRLDAFDDLAARLGTEAADAILVETALLLGEHFEPLSGSICRWENATFAVLLDGVARPEAVRHAAEFRARLEQAGERWRLPAGGADATLRVTSSIGLATVEPATASLFGKVQQLMTASARAMDAASGSGGNCVKAFTPRAAA